MNKNANSVLLEQLQKPREKDTPYWKFFSPHCKQNIMCDNFLYLSPYEKLVQTLIENAKMNLKFSLKSWQNASESLESRTKVGLDFQFCQKR